MNNFLNFITDNPQQISWIFAGMILFGMYKILLQLVLGIKELILKFTPQDCTDCVNAHNIKELRTQVLEAISSMRDKILNIEKEKSTFEALDRAKKEIKEDVTRDINNFKELILGKFTSINDKIENIKEDNMEMKSWIKQLLDRK
jgi:hypothetical protein